MNYVTKKIMRRDLYRNLISFCDLQLSSVIVFVTFVIVTFCYAPGDEIELKKIKKINKKNTFDQHCVCLQ